MFRKIKNFLCWLDDLAEIVVMNALWFVMQPGVLAAVLALSLVFLCRMPNLEIPVPRPVAANDLLVGRVWIDSMPQNPMDTFSLYVFTDYPTDDDESLWGIYQSGVLVKFTTEVVSYNYCPANIQISWLFDKNKNNTKYSVVRETNGEFDLKLKLESDPRHGNRPYVYYAHTDEEDSALMLARMRMVVFPGK